MRRPLYVMLIGLPGSGKSTLAAQLSLELTARDWATVSTDRYVDEIAALTGTTYDAVFQSAIDSATKRMNLDRAAALAARRDVLHDQTNLTGKSRARKLADVPKVYLRVGLVCEVTEEVRRRRLVGRPGKVIPSEVDARMVAQFERPRPEEFDAVATNENWQRVLGDLA